MLSLENPDLFKEEMEKCGFHNVMVTPFNGEWPVSNAEKFLDSMIRGSAPLEMMRKNLPDDLWAEKRKLMQSYLEKHLPALPATLHSKAFIATGTK